MDELSLTSLVDAQIDAARGATNGRSAHTVYGGTGCVLRQTVLALAAGHGLDDHESPGEATLLVLRGRVRLGAAADTAEIGQGDYLVIPPERHNLVAVEDSAVLLSVVARR
ncbi:cupin domain-containing protein [Mycolicibacterium palauense]|uniref:cupin domain-containing protein n=1 Tax=Mycolicibacterium palauense TaxID=2034511 RepID=UPI000BFEC89C|nr:cupin domain-containing protein [Mycolicibacterium palauense]